MPNYGPVIDKLLTKSEAGGFPWKPTYDDDTFVSALEGEVTFEVSRRADGGIEFLMKDKNGRKIIELTSHNRGASHDDYVEDDRFFDELRRIYEAARVTALDVDRKLNVAEALLDRF